MDDKEKAQRETMKYAVDPQLVSVWQIENGYLRNEEGVENLTIQYENGLIRKNYFNNIMKDVMGEFNELLNYYD